MRRLTLLLLSLLLFIPILPTHASSGDLSISDADVWFTNSFFLEGNPTRIWASIHNNSNADLLGTVRFTTKDGLIGSDQPISIMGGKTDEVFVDWTPPSYGAYTITVTVIPWESGSDNASNNTAQKTITVEQDTDHDGLVNASDPDQDGDNVLNEDDTFPLNRLESKDSDGDGKGNNEDTDDDNDGTLDTEDQLPEDSLYTKDQDGDGVPDETDEDMDGDELSNEEEVELATDPANSDTDSDAALDGQDPFPLDAKEWSDLDGDETGDNSDEDMDGDGIKNEEDADPSDPSPVAHAEADASIANLGEEVHFDASASTDNNSIVQYVWQIGNEMIIGPTASYTFHSTGEQTAVLTVYDENGQSDSTELTVRVLDYTFLMKAGVLVLLLVSLAFAFIYRYNRRALLPKS
jgi:PKD domain